jgi:hypothetical protein
MPSPLSSLSRLPVGGWRRWQAASGAIQRIKPLQRASVSALSVRKHTRNGLWTVIHSLRRRWALPAVLAFAVGGLASLFRGGRRPAAIGQFQSSHSRSTRKT